jgi:hypothetical protein
MSLGLLAKDSVLDLEALGRGAVERADDKGFLQKQHQPTTSSSSSSIRSQQQEKNVGDNNLLAATTTTTVANPQQPEEENGQHHSNHPYAGFHSNYDASLLFYHDDYYNYYPHDALYASDNVPVANNIKKTTNTWWCCLFPWMQQSQPPSLSSSSSSSQPMNSLSAVENKKEKNTLRLENKNRKKNDCARTTTTTATTTTSTAVVVVEEKDFDDDDEELSTSSSALGERLSEKERQVLLARLGLALPEPDRRIHITHHHDHHHNAEEINNNNISSSYHQQQNKLHHPQQQQQQQQHPFKTGEGGSSSSDHSHRSMISTKGLLNGIPVYDTSPLMQEEESCVNSAVLETNDESKLKGILKNRRTVSNSVMKNGVIPNDSSSSDNGSSSALALATRRRSLFPSYEKRPKSSADDNKSVLFAPMARVVTVKSRNDMTELEKSDIWWQRSDYEDFRKTGRIITRAMLEGGSEIWLAASNNGSSSSSSSSSAKAHENSDATATGDKWWHKFGHSRRGLEHVVSMEEGRQRQANVKNAIRCVLDEQARQKLYNRVDPEKLRNVALNHTYWARDLALAAGASDADAVESSFAADRRSREFFLSKMVKSSPHTNKIGGKLPQFMQPTIPHGVPSAAVANARNYNIQQQLDANTTAQIRFRRRGKVTPLDPSRSPALSATKDLMEKGTESCEPLHDPKPEEKHHKSMAEQAAGFLPSSDEKVNMAAVLSGLGADLAVNEKAKSKVT